LPLSGFIHWVYIDEYLIWKEHVKVIASKIAKNLEILSKIAYLLHSKILINLYYTLTPISYMEILFGLPPTIRVLSVLSFYRKGQLELLLEIRTMTILLKGFRKSGIRIN